MSLRIVGAISLALMCAMVLAVGAGARSRYNITVNLDETTRGDMDVVATSVQSATIGSEVPRSLRRLATGAAGELALLASGRVDVSGNLRLDDGSIAALVDGDEVLVSATGDSQVDYANADGSTARAAAKRVLLIREPCTTDRCSMKPSAVLIAQNGGGCRLILLFAHPPIVSSCS